MARVVEAGCRVLLHGGFLARGHAVQGHIRGLHFTGGMLLEHHPRPSGLPQDFRRIYPGKKTLLRQSPERGFRTDKDRRSQRPGPWCRTRGRTVRDPLAAIDGRASDARSSKHTPTVWNLRIDKDVKYGSISSAASMLTTCSWVYAAALLLGADREEVLQIVERRCIP